MTPAPKHIPGYTDLQVNGFRGVGFSDPELSEQAFVDACLGLLSHGTRLFLPTLITSPHETYRRNLPLMSRAIREFSLEPCIPGFHLEGPFISRMDGARGAHNPDFISEPNPKLLDQLMTWADGRIRLLTIAADAPGADDLCRHAVSIGITVSLGHHMASSTDLERLADSGARALTHFGNALPALLPRHENPLLAGLACDRLTAMIIADGHHLPASLVDLILRVKGIDHVTVVSDAAPVAGMPPGTYHTLGNDVRLEENGLLHNPQTGYMVGSSCTMTECARWLEERPGLLPEELDRLTFYNALRLIGLDPDSVATPIPVDLTRLCGGSTPAATGLM